MNIEPTETCSRGQGPRHGYGCPLPHYPQSVSELWDSELGRMTRTGLCVECGAACYQNSTVKAAGQYWHAHRGCFTLIVNPD